MLQVLYFLFDGEVEKWIELKTMKEDTTSIYMWKRLMKKLVSAGTLIAIIRSFSLKMFYHHSCQKTDGKGLNL